MKTLKQTIIAVLAILCCSSGFAAAETPIFRWGDTDIHYDRDTEPAVFLKKAFAFPAWRGEKVNAEAVLWSSEALQGVRVTASELKSGKNVISADALSVYFVRYVIGDKLAEQYGQCGQRDTVNWQKYLSPDMLDNVSVTDVPAGNTQPVWVTVKVPADAAPGKYRGSLTLSGEGIAPQKLAVELEVVDRLMPAPSEWGFHLDLWQNPFSVARYHDVPLWSEEHFELLRPVMQMLADAGQKVITASILDRPWNGQTEDPFKPMVTKIKRADGSWLYDYTVFDKWVEFMMGLGIDKQIDCYTMVPWKMTFDYYDQASNEIMTIDCGVQSAEYVNYWSNFLRDFESHLRQKGWLEITNIAMDERPMDTMQSVISLVKSVAPGLGIALAANYSADVEQDISSLSITSTREFPENVRARRLSEGKVSTYYTCCAEGYPNTFMASVPAEASWIGWYAFAHNFEGYLRWSYNSWTVDPVHDARFRTWAAGDTYIVYPDGRSSVRFEKFIEGIRDYEKARIVKEGWEAAGETRKLAEFQKLMDEFVIPEIPVKGASAPVHAARALIAR